MRLTAILGPHTSPEALDCVQEACRRRGVEFVALPVRDFDACTVEPLPPGDMLLRLGSGVAERHVERQLWGPRVSPVDPFLTVFDTLRCLERQGLPVPRWVHVNGRHPEQLQDYLAYLGGLPVWVHPRGRLQGSGAHRVTNEEALHGVLSVASEQGRVPLLVACVGAVARWRCAVVAGRVVGALECGWRPQVPDAVAAIAVRSLHALQHDVGTVDVEVTARGRRFVQHVRGEVELQEWPPDRRRVVAARTVDELVARSGRLVPPAEMDRLERVSESPALWTIDGFASPEECASLRRLTADLTLPERHQIEVTRGAAGLSYELPPSLHPVAATIASRTYRALGLACAVGGTLRYRHYRAGESHPGHHDVFEVNGRHLVAAALLHLTDVAAGGATRFPRRAGRSLEVEPHEGRLVVWLNHLDDGQVDPAAWHEARPVEAGQKSTLTRFLYASLHDVAPLRRCLVQASPDVG